MVNTAHNQKEMQAPSSLTLSLMHVLSVSLSPSVCVWLSFYHLLVPVKETVLKVLCGVS